MSTASSSSEYRAAALMCSPAATSYPNHGLSAMLLTNRLLFVTAQWSMWLIATIFDLLVGKMARDRDRPERLEQELTASFRTRSEADRDVWDRNPELRRVVTAGLRLIAGRRSGRGSIDYVAWDRRC
ncbi:hypothetical protein F4809DRAFT_634536 [Biscogniauxia mediterranea]|nr:hypothetical protein F4809DRAFT_634536 [Biscogniauxia mediterranea]